MLLPLLFQFLSTANFVVGQTPATVQPGQCRTTYKCADDSGQVRIPGGKGGGGDHVEEKCLEAESIVNPDGSWGGSNCTKPLIEWVDEDPKDPNTVWACSCPPGAEKQRLPLRPGTRSAAASCPSQATGAETNYKNVCPNAHGRRETINGVQYEYSCESTLSPLSEELSITGIHHPRACASFCSDNPACEGLGPGMNGTCCDHSVVDPICI